MGASGKYRAAVIGAGAIAQECHLPGYAKDPRAELVAFADPSRARHIEIERKYPGVRGFTDYREMLAELRPDVVSVCTPNAFHADMVVEAFAHRCHVLCEKPLATTLADTDRMIAAGRKARRKLMTGFTHRLFSGPIACREVLRERGIGKPFMIRVRNAHGGPYPGWAKDSWFYKPELAGGGVLLDMGIHSIDLCLWLFGPVVSVQAQTATLVKRISLEDNALLLLEFRSGALGYIEVGWTSKPGFGGLEIYGTRGTLICDYFSSLRLCTGTASAGSDSSYEWETLEENPLEGGWDSEIAHWLDVLDGKRRLEMSGLAGRRALEVALAAYESSRTGRRIAVGS